MIRVGESSELEVTFLAQFPQYNEMFQDIRSKYEALVSQTQEEYDRIKEMPKGGSAEQKAFAMEALKSQGRAAMFQVRAGKSPSIRAFYAEMPINGLMEMLKVKVAEDQEE